MIYLISEQTRINHIKEIELKIKEASNDYIVAATLFDCLLYFKDKNIIEVDTETEHNKRNPEHLPNPYENKILCLQLGDKENQFVIDPNTVDISPLKVLFEDESKIKIFCNSFFDLRFIHHWNFRIKNVYDIFLAEMLIHLGKILPKGYRGLEQMSKRYLDIEVSKEVRGQIHWRGLDDTVIRYAANDVAHMNDIRERQLFGIKQYHLETALELENRFVIVLSHIAYKGFKLDQNKWLEVSLANKKKLEEIKLQLDNYLIENKLFKYIDSTLFFGQVSSINWDSSKQVIKLFKDIGIDTLARDKFTGQMKDSVDIKHLSKQKKKFTILPIYIRYKELQKELSTYGKDFLKENINPITGKIHSEYFQLVDTGRISSSNPNLQNIPATDENGEISPLRQCFIAGEGNILVLGDYSQQEPRILAEYCQDPYLIDFILNGDGDSHSLVSTIISEYLLKEHIKVTKKNNPVVPRFNQKIRDIGKMINLGLDYGKTAFSVKDDLDTTQEEAQKLIDIIAAKTPKKTEYFKQCFEYVKNDGYIIIDPITKRRTWFSKYQEYKDLSEKVKFNRDKKLYSEFSKIKGEMERFSRNYKIQGTGGSMTKLAAIYFYKEIDKHDLWNKIWLVNLVHDELDAESQIEYKDLAATLLTKAMEDAGKVFCKQIPMKVEPSICSCWEK